MNETQQLEHYVHGTLPTEERLLMEARLIVDTELRNKLDWQQKAYALIHAYGRKKLRAEIEQIQNRLFTEDKFKIFRKRIQTIFK
jgi:anti-sigma-K factor RskA